MHVWDGSSFGTWSSVDGTATSHHSKMLVPVISYTWTRALGIRSDKIWRLSHKYFAYYINFWLFFSFMSLILYLLFLETESLSFCAQPLSTHFISLGC